MHVLCIHTHKQTHKHTHTCVLFTYPQLEVNKGGAEGKPASTLLTLFLFHREKIFLQLDSSALNVASLSCCFLEQTSCRHLTHKKPVEVSVFVT